MAWTGGEVVGRTSLRQRVTGACGSQVRADRTELAADFTDLAFVDLVLVDDAGIVHTDADRRVEVVVEGAGVLQGLGSANPAVEEPFTEQRLHDLRRTGAGRRPPDRRRVDHRHRDRRRLRPADAHPPGHRVVTIAATTTAPDGTVFRDLNGNGRLDPYEDHRLPVADRVHDLVGRMTVEEKVGLLFQTTIEPGADGSLDEEQAILGGPPTSELVEQRHLRHFNLPFFPAEVALLATWNNRIQAMAEATRLGIPVTLSTDPCHAAVQSLGTMVAAGRFSTWPREIGLAALHDVDAIREFAEIARSEYLAVGLRTALHPQVDLATEPRWARLANTFGADPRVRLRRRARVPRRLPGPGAVLVQRGLHDQALPRRGAAARR